MAGVKVSTRKGRTFLTSLVKPSADESPEVIRKLNQITVASTITHNNFEDELVSSVLLNVASLGTNSNAEPRILSSSEHCDAKRKNKISPSSAKPSSSNSGVNPDSKATEESSNKSSEYLKCLSLKENPNLKFIPVLLLIGALCFVVIFIPIYLLVIQRQISQSSFSNMTASICSTTTCIGKESSFRSSSITSLYPFDGAANDWIGYGTGILLGSSTPSFTASSYVGIQAISLNPTFFQYIQISSINLAQKSFTIEVWVSLSVSIAGDFGIFEVCDISSKCLSISSRNGRFALTFDAMNTNNTFISSTVISVWDWVHLAVVYDASLYQQQIYVNGILDSTSVGVVSPFQGSLSGLVTTIGKTTTSSYGTTYYYGKIDNVAIFAGTVRTACQIYNDATLVAYYPFETTNSFNDYSVNSFNGFAYGTSISTGAIGQALYFSTSVSYFQAQCFTTAKYSNPPYSFSLWVNPTTSNGNGTIIHFSTLQNGNGTCYDPLVFASTGELVVQTLTNTPTVLSVKGVALSANTWTHVAVVVGSVNSIRLFINGQLTAAYVTSSAISIYTVTGPQYLTFGNTSPYGWVNCKNGSISTASGPFIGGIDEFRMYNRELTFQEICVLANL